MQTMLAFIQYVLGFVPFLGIVAILLTLFWAATKLIPSLGEWMTNTDGMPEAELYDEEIVPASSTFDQYI